LPPYSRKWHEQAEVERVVDTLHKIETHLRPSSSWNPPTTNFEPPTESKLCGGWVLVPTHHKTHQSPCLPASLHACIAVYKPAHADIMHIYLDRTELDWFGVPSNRKFETANMP